MQKHSNLFWFSVLLIAWFFDFLFYKHAPGISFAIYALLTLSGGFILLWLDGLRPARATLILLPFILYFAAMTFIRAEPLSVLLAHAFTLFLMAGLAVTYRGGLWLRYSLADYFSRAFELIASMAARPLSFFLDIQRLRQDQTKDNKPLRRFWPVLRGILIAIPVVAFFAALLSSADLIFAQRLQVITDLLRLENLSEYLFRLAYILVIAYILAGIYLHAATRSAEEKLLGLDKPLIQPFFGFTEASIMLGSVVLLFAIFVAIQFQYFFGGQANINLSGYTYAEYARKGFGELVMVAFFALLLFLGLTAIVKRGTLRHRQIFSGLGVTLFALVAIMLVSAYQRLVLYESAYGFTRLRTYSHVFMIWVPILLAVVVLLDLVQRQRVFALAALCATLGFAISLTLLNVDVFILERNVTRYQQGQDLDIGYLASLSSDAIPAMISLYEQPGTPSALRDRLGAAMACIQDGDSHRTEQSWQSFHLSSYRASLSMNRMGPALAPYHIDHSAYPITVLTPLNDTYDCYSSSGD